MRPTTELRSFLRFPLDELLGTVAQVRLLRILTAPGVETISAPEAAERSGLTAAGARRALARLVRTGFVIRVGDRSQRFRLRRDELLLEALGSLFSAERRRFERLVSAIGESLEPFAEIKTAWIAELPTDVTDALDLFVLTDPRSLADLVTELRRRILHVERAFDLTIEIRAHTEADAPPVDWRGAILVAGVPSIQTGGEPLPGRMHADRERRALRMSEAIVTLLERDPSLVSRAMAHLERILEGEHGAASHDLREWLDLLRTYSPERLARFLVADSPRANRLRQSSPFFAVLGPDERDRVLASLEKSG